MPKKERSRSRGLYERLKKRNRNKRRGSWLPRYKLLMLCAYCSLDYTNSDKSCTLEIKTLLNSLKALAGARKAKVLGHTRCWSNYCLPPLRQQNFFFSPRCSGATVEIIRKRGVKHFNHSHGEKAKRARLRDWACSTRLVVPLSRHSCRCSPL